MILYHDIALLVWGFFVSESPFGVTKDARNKNRYLMTMYMYHQHNNLILYVFVVECFDVHQTLTILETKRDVGGTYKRYQMPVNAVSTFFREIPRGVISPFSRVPAPDPRQYRTFVFLKFHNRQVFMIRRMCLLFTIIIIQTN